MKESNNKYDLNNDIDNQIENRFNEELEEIKEKINSEKLSDEFKEKLQAKLQEELNKNEDLRKSKILKFPEISRKLAGICACFIFLFSSCFVFADDIENVILELFRNTDRIIAKAIEEGKYKEINMDYVEDQGVSIKVDYVIVEDDALYIAFNVLGEEEHNKIFFYDINIKNRDGVILYTNNVKEEKSKFVSYKNYIYNSNMIIVYKLTESKFDFAKFNDLNIEISEIIWAKKDVTEKIKGNWNLEINI